MRLWLIPMIYVGVSVICGLTLPRIEQAYFASHILNLSVASAQAYLSAVASGMMALTGVVFAMAFVMVQFSAIAYSPRLVLWFARDRVLFHSLGVFAATGKLKFRTSLHRLQVDDAGLAQLVGMHEHVLAALAADEAIAAVAVGRIVLAMCRSDHPAVCVLDFLAQRHKETDRTLSQCPLNPRVEHVDTDLHCIVQLLVPIEPVVQRRLGHFERLRQQ
jgi:predicted membrane protein DUF2254